ncbi:MAG: hypothetical protein M3R24_00900 [Chloroflexota bacterium]|nr:hypothetical protein [Chloroflexota bacterium]
MDQKVALLQEAIHCGYVVKDRGTPTVWQEFHVWCVLHHQPFVSIDRSNLGKPSSTGVAVLINLFPTRREDHQCHHFTPAVLRDAGTLAQACIRVPDRARAKSLTMSPTCIRVNYVAPERAEHLARACGTLSADASAAHLSWLYMNRAVRRCTGRWYRQIEGR